MKMGSVLWIQELNNIAIKSQRESHLLVIFDPQNAIIDSKLLDTSSKLNSVFRFDIGLVKLGNF